MTSSNGTGKGRHVVVVGASFAGLGAAYTLRAQLPPADRITVIAPSDHFTFAPSLVSAAFGRSSFSSSFDLEAALTTRDIGFVRAAVQEIRASDRIVATAAAEFSYDRLVIATGGRPDNQAIPGLAGEFRAASWVVGEDSAMEARNAIRALLDDPGPVVVGAAQGASYLSAAYELALTLDATLRRRQMRDRAPITFVTAEPWLGHLGFGQTAARAYLEQLFRARDITWHTGITIDRVQDHIVRISSGPLEARTAIIMPPFTGAVGIWKSASLTDAKGLIPITERYQHVEHPDIYAAGVAAYFQSPVQPLNGTGAPHTGFLALRMGKAAGQSVAASLGAGNVPQQALPTLVDMRVIDGRTTGLLLTSRGRDRLHHRAIPLPGPLAHTTKDTLERYLLWRLRTGHIDLP
jgi:sulfide:quinone oxidoreductase